MAGNRGFSPVIDVESNEDSTEMLFVKKRFCFCIPYTSSDQSATAGLRSIWTTGISSLKKLREWSEIVAGPKWKTFIRRFNRTKSSKYQYDPLSYALNFDEGPIQNADPVEADEYMARNFSSRYATVPGSAKGSLDLSNEGPSFS